MSAMWPSTCLNCYRHLCDILGDQNKNQIAMNTKTVPFQFNTGVRSLDFEEARTFINSHLDDRDVSPLSFHNRGRLSENLLTLQPLGTSALFGAMWSEKVHVQSEIQSTFHAVLVLSGQIHCKSLATDAPAHSLILIAPGRCADLIWERGTQAVVMSLGKQSIIDNLGVPNLEFLRQTNTIIPASHPDAQLLRNIILCLANQHEIAQGRIEPSVQNHWEGLLLCQFANQLHPAELGMKSILPARIRMATDWILAHIREPISVCDLLLITGTSRRSLESGFRTYLNTTPARFILCHKLKGVREILRNEPEITIGDAAFLYGFNHLSHFTRQYQDAFGELPSETLRRCRGARIGFSKKAQRRPA